MEINKMANCLNNIMNQDIIELNDSQNILEVNSSVFSSNSELKIKYPNIVVLPDRSFSSIKHENVEIIQPVLNSIQYHKNNLIKHLNFGIEVSELFLSTYHEGCYKAIVNHKNLMESVRQGIFPLKVKNSKTPIFTEYCLESLIQAFRNHLELLKAISESLNLSFSDKLMVRLGVIESKLKELCE